MIQYAPWKGQKNWTSSLALDGSTDQAFPSTERSGPSSVSLRQVFTTATSPSSRSE